MQLCFILVKEQSFYPVINWKAIKSCSGYLQYSHEPFIATYRFWYLTGKAQEYQEALQQKQAPGYGAFGGREQHLADHAFTGDRYTIADIGLFAYTHFAGEGGFDLTRFPAIQSWINRVKNQAGYIKTYYNARTLPSPFSVV